MRLPLNGDEAVAYAVKHVDVDVIAAYPITPQTIIVEKLSEFVYNGELDAEFIHVESEHSAISTAVGAALAGARVFTATASQGYAYMHEILHIAASLRLPIVMAVANRALSAPINIHCDHGDVMNGRDTGRIMLFAENAQEAYDTTIQAYKIAEDPEVQLPVIVALDGFTISHTTEDVEVLDEEVVRKYVGKRKPREIELPHVGKKVPYDVTSLEPISVGTLALPDYYEEVKYQQFEAMKRVPEVVRRVNEEYAKLSGRSYGDGLIDVFNEDADYAIVVLGSTAGTARALARKRKDFSVVRIKLFRPFPHEELAKILEGKKAVAVLDRMPVYRQHGGALYLDVLSSLYYLDEKPIVVDYVYGLGGRDVSMKTIEKIVEDLKRTDKASAMKERVRRIDVRK